MPKTVFYTVASIGAIDIYEEDIDEELTEQAAIDAFYTSFTPEFLRQFASCDDIYIDEVRDAID